RDQRAPARARRRLPLQAAPAGHRRARALHRRRAVGRAGGRRGHARRARRRPLRRRPPAPLPQRARLRRHARHELPSGWLIENTGPWGSRRTALRKPPPSAGAIITPPPSSVAWLAIASASSTRKLTFQCGGTAGFGGAITATMSRGSVCCSWPPT